MLNSHFTATTLFSALALIAIGSGNAVATDEPASYVLTGIIRDFPPESGHVDFTVTPSATPGARSARNLALALDADDKPVFVGDGRRINQEWRDASSHKISWCQPAAPGDILGSFQGDDDGGIENADSFAQWFRDTPGINMSRLWNIEMTPQADGSYVFDTSNFHPIDEQLLGNGPDEHNFYFTYEIVCTFTYDASASQYVWFRGDDDTWIFVDKRLVIDHGGVAANREQRIDLNRMGLIDGQEYQLHFFFAERYQPQSQFHLQTNIALESAGSNSVLAAYD